MNDTTQPKEDNYWMAFHMDRTPPHHSYSIQPIQVTSFFTPPGSSKSCVALPLLINGQPPRSGADAPRIVIEARNPDEALYLSKIVEAALANFTSRHEISIAP